MPTESADKRQGGQASEHVTLADDELYRALASTQRRRLLHLLLVSDAGAMSVDKLVTLLSGWTATDSGAAVSPDEHARTRIALTHVHLPRLEKLGLIEYDPDGGTVDVATVDPAVATLIERSVGGDRSARQ